MSDANIILLQSIRSDLEQTKLISQNIANSTTPGFKSVQSHGVDFSNLVNTTTVSHLGKASALVKQHLNLDSGQLKATGRSLDVSVNGTGFMLAETNGVEHLVSSHQFRVNEDGLITTQQGGLLQGLNGPIKLSSGNVFINDIGEVIQSEKVLGQLRIVKPIEGSQLSLHPLGLMVAEKIEDSAEGEFKVISGQIQTSNVDSSQQMVKLMELTKHIESSQRAFSTLDQLLNTGINQIGKN